MTDYVKALTEGFKAADDAALAQQEIDDVFNVLYEQVSKASEGKISIDRVKKEGYNIGIDLLDQFLKKAEEWVIVAYSGFANGKRINEVNLAGWKPNPRGYPCEITWSHIQNNCADREALELTLAELLADASTGRKLKSLIEKDLGEKA